MLKIYNLKDKRDYLKQVAILEHNEWGHTTSNTQEFENKINKKIENIVNQFNNKYFCKLILLDNDNLIGFISIFPNDCEEKSNLSPWYSTMYVKKVYRKNGYSKILNDAILNEAKNRKIKRLYLKTNLENYYENLGAKFMDFLSNGEKLYYFDI